MRERPLTEFISKKGTKEKKKPEKPKGLKGPWELPEGWRWVRLGEILSFQYGISKKLSDSGRGYPILRMNNITHDGKLDLSDLKFVELSKEEFKKYKLEKGDILINRTNSKELVGKTTVFNIEGDYVFASYIIRGRLKVDNIMPEFIALFMNSPYMKANFLDMARLAVQMANINAKELSRVLIPLPPLEEQKCIVAKLDELNKRIAEAKRLAREAREEAERLMASALHEVFSKAEEKGWEWVRLGDVAELKAGGTPSRRIKEYWENGTIPWVKISDIPDSGIVEKTEEKITEQGLRNSSAKVLPPGTILFSIFATISKVGILKIPAATNQAIVGIIPRIPINRNYLFYSLKYFGQELVYLGRGGVQDNINKRMLAKLKIPLPPLEEQKRIVAYLDRISERAQRLVKLYEEREKELEKLFPAMLDRAFKGEL